jgi:hypothetical protein
MTIIRPAAQHNYTKFLLFLFGIVLIGGIFYICEYNAFANTRFQVKSMKRSLVEAQVKNTELRNNIFKTTDLKTLEALTGAHQLVLDRQPEYLQ